MLARGSFPKHIKISKAWQAPTQWLYASHLLVISCGLRRCRTMSGSVKLVAQNADLNEPNRTAIVYVSSHDGRLRGMPRNGTSLMFAVDEPVEDYLPRPAPMFQPSRIVLAKGSNRTQSHRRLAERICAAYPDAEIVEAFGIPHNRVDLGETDPLRLHDRGKQTFSRISSEYGKSLSP